MKLISLLKHWLNVIPMAPAQAPAAQQLQNRKMVDVPLNWQLKQASAVRSTVAHASKETEKKPLRTARLIMVSAYNNNKFYEMKEQPDDTFLAAYGRVGTSGTSVSYPMRLWDRKIKEKLNKGYFDQTFLFAKEIADTGLEAIDHPGVRELMSYLMNAARQSIRHNYQVSADQVTQMQVDQAQLVLDQLVDLAGKTKVAGDINEHLLELYRIIPRRMRRVQDHLIDGLNDAEDRSTLDKLLSEEQATLDVMRGQVKMNTQRQTQKNEPTNLLQSMGLSVEPVTEKESIKHIRQIMGKDARKFHRAYAVVNHQTQAAFDHFIAETDCKDTQLFWHGSRNENWLSILGSGLVLRPANAVITGKMFGYGLYFADKCRKSLNYSSLRGSYWSGGTQNRAYLALYDVHVGRQLKIKKHKDWCYELTKAALKKRGAYDSLFAQGGADLINNEYIVYDEAQSTVRYLIELRD